MEIKGGREEDLPGWIGCVSMKYVPEDDFKTDKQFIVFKREDSPTWFRVGFVRKCSSVTCSKLHYTNRFATSVVPTKAYIDELISKGFSPINLKDTQKFVPIIQRTREAIYSWTLCALRMGVSRDVRLLIARSLFEDFRAWE